MPCLDGPSCPSQADTTLPAEQRRNYKGVFDALTRIVKDEGMGGLFTGAGPTVVRACALNMGMLASNDQVGSLGGWANAMLVRRPTSWANPPHAMSPALI